jgi:hypothetical protein
MDKSAIKFIRGMFEYGNADDGIKNRKEEGCFLVEKYDDPEEIIKYATDRGFKVYEQHFDGTENCLIEANKDSNGFLVIIDKESAIVDYIARQEGGCCFEDGDYNITWLDIESTKLPNLAELNPAITFEK